MTSEEDIQEELREIQQAVDRNPRTEGLWEMWRPLFTWRIFQRYVLRIGGKRKGGEVTPACSKLIWLASTPSAEHLLGRMPPCP